MRAETARPRAAPAWRNLPGLLAVTATYVSFLLHAQFGFLALVQQHAGTSSAIRGVMAAMALAGLAASLAAGALLARVPPRRLVVTGLAGCALAALASLACASAAAFAVVAAAVGAFTGLVTVALASDLRALVQGPRFGLQVGAATGLAYLVSNLPFTFHGGPVVQALVPAALCVLAAVVLLVTPAPAAPPRECLVLGERDARGLGFATLVLSFLALVWLDSAAFRIVQETAALRGQTWGSPAQSTLQGLVHLAAALLAGWLVDRGRFRSLLLATWAVFGVAFALLQHGDLPMSAGGPLYAVGISLYSTLLVLAPSLGPAGEGLVPRRWRAALIYGVAGWLGSTLGIGMAQDLHRIPAPFAWGAGAVLAACALLAWQGTRMLVRTHAPALGLAAIPLVLVLRPAPPGPELSAVERGRRVYVAEGCINCHSQYVRPQTSDAGTWGPYREDELRESPPLLGNRRLGPDLLNVGTRSSAEWHVLHLEDPRSVSPGSRMPSFAHLFAEGDRRGEDLVAYLASLGRASGAGSAKP